jgi:hypothetical protein
VTPLNLENWSAPVAVSINHQAKGKNSHKTGPEQSSSPPCAQGGSTQSSSNQQPAFKKNHVRVEGNSALGLALDPYHSKRLNNELPLLTSEQRLKLFKELCNHLITLVKDKVDKFYVSFVSSLHPLVR